MGKVAQKKVSRRNSVRVAKSSRLSKTKVITKSAKTKVYKELSKRERSTLVLNYRENGRKLARSILRKWRVRMPLEEVDSIVDLSLCEAAGRYSKNHGASFMTFFFYHLRGQLVRAVSAAAEANTVFLACAETAGIDTSEWYHINLSEDENKLPEYFGEAYYQAETPEQTIIRQQEIDVCRGAYGKLDSLEKEVINRSFKDEEALVDVARELGYSRCHISRVKRGALDRLKEILSGNEVPESTQIHICGSQKTVLKRAEKAMAASAKVAGHKSTQKEILRRARRKIQLEIKAA